ncbi:hypothetical protein HY249_02110 [Candidatus Azambacteria bacterium]|nr:hypothetical protein [Candidatus Azambacteria bacterium]
MPYKIGPDGYRSMEALLLYKHARKMEKATAMRVKLARLEREIATCEEEAAKIGLNLKIKQIERQENIMRGVKAVFFEQRKIAGSSEPKNLPLKAEIDAETQKLYKAADAIGRHIAYLRNSENKKIGRYFTPQFA